jgi:hypothetical protein
MAFQGEKKGETKNNEQEPKKAASMNKYTEIEAIE